MFRLRPTTKRSGAAGVPFAIRRARFIRVRESFFVQTRGAVLRRRAGRPPIFCVAQLWLRNESTQRVVGGSTLQRMLAQKPGEPTR